MKDDRLDATLEALRHPVGSDEHMPHLQTIVAGRVGPVTFAEIAEALASVDVSGRDPEWLADWADLIETIRRRPRGSELVEAAAKKVRRAGAEILAVSRQSAPSGPPRGRTIGGKHLNTP